MNSGDTKEDDGSGVGVVSAGAFRNHLARLFWEEVAQAQGGYLRIRCIGS